MHFTVIAIMLSLVVAAPALAAPPAGDAVHAPQGAAPGSYEDWCGEHQVPESLDTRCNPALIPAFKATKDWCAEHGLPESQCLKCNPSLKIVRPPKPGAAVPKTVATPSAPAVASPPSAAAGAPKKTPPEISTGHAPKGAVAGSYADWCGEHQVPESLDTRCNPALIPAFKATKDWCAEHGLPESQCLKCNPDLKILRPPKPAGVK
jgi:hypothetical protein